MSNVHLRDLDLGALVLLRTLLDTHSVTATAARLGLTQSAVSHALRGLRDTLDDPLLVRVGNRMQPTARAASLHEPLARALSDLEIALSPSTFSPATATRTFTLATSDYATAVLLPPLYALLAAEAPGVDLRVQPIPDDLGATLARGDLDLAVQVTRAIEPAEGLYSQALWDESFVVLLRAGHPALSAPWTPEAFAAIPQVLITPRGRLGGPVDTALARLGLTRRVAVTVPTFLVAPLVVRGSDAVLTIGRRIAELLPDGLVTLSPPLHVPPFRVASVWHARRHADPGLRWLRERIRDLAADFGGLTGE